MYELDMKLKSFIPQLVVFLGRRNPTATLHNFTNGHCFKHWPRQIVYPSTRTLSPFLVLQIKSQDCLCLYNHGANVNGYHSYEISTYIGDQLRESRVAQRVPNIFKNGFPSRQNQAKKLQYIA